MFVRILTVFSLLVALPAAMAGSEGKADRSQQFIEQARQRLGGSLLTSPEEIIERHVLAIGGRERLLAAETMKVEGRNLILMEEARPLIRYFKQPGWLYQTSPGASSYILSDGKDVYSVNSGERSLVTQRWTPALKHTRIDGNFIDYLQLGITVEYIDLEAFETEPTVFYHVKRTFPDGYVDDLYFDVDSGLLRMVSENGDTATRRAFYEYREVGGIRVPHLMLTLFDGVLPPHVFIVDKVEVNGSIPDEFAKEIE